MILPISDVVLLPANTYTIFLNELTAAERKSLENKEAVFALPLKSPRSRAEVKADDIFPVGVCVEIKSFEDHGEDCKVTLKALGRIRITELTVTDELIFGEWSELDEIMDLSEANRAEMLSALKRIVGDIAGHFPQGKALTEYMDGITDLNVLMVFQSQFMALSAEERYSLMETSSLKERSTRFLDLLLKNEAAASFQLEMAEKLSEENQKRYRQAVLKRQLEEIKAELNDADEQESSESAGWERRIKQAHMPGAVEKEALRQLERLRRAGQNGHESDSITDYLELLTGLPWTVAPAADIRIAEARRILEEQHYGLQKVKGRILQHLSVMQLRSGNPGSILLLVGPPGTGKTSLGKSVAQALGRKYIRLSLGGIRDEAEIRGHRRTYVGSMPGRIIQEIRKAGVMDPVMVLDEVDKIAGGGYNGDPAGALLEVLDPEQHNTFTDHYLNVPYDLSHVFFICTANSADTIPQPLLDRMEVIQVSGYTAPEKLLISRQHLVPKALAEHGLSEEKLQFKDASIEKIIAGYTMESGVRGLKKKIDAICRDAAARIVEKKVNALPFVVDADNLETILDHKPIDHDCAAEYNPAGVVTGLAWTAAGGDILFVEVASIPGSGQIITTGQLGDVMKESAAISVSLLKSRLPINSINLKERDIHIHVPSGAVPKDGPSAGITLFTALVSMVTGIPVDPKLAMTGEITLRGSVLPIGGLKEKLMAAQRAGIQKILIPQKNEADLKDIPESVKETLTIVPIGTVDELLQEVFGNILPYMGEDFRFISMFPVRKSLCQSTA